MTLLLLLAVVLTTVWVGFDATKRRHAPLKVAR
jgi:hypothetical protein